MLRAAAAAPLFWRCCRYMVMDFYDHDLKMLMEALPQNFSQVRRAR